MPKCSCSCRLSNQENEWSKVTTIAKGFTITLWRRVHRLQLNPRCNGVSRNRQGFLHIDIPIRRNSYLFCTMVCLWWRIGRGFCEWGVLHILHRSPWPTMSFRSRPRPKCPTWSQMTSRILKFNLMINLKMSKIVTKKQIAIELWLWQLLVHTSVTLDLHNNWIHP